MHSPRPRRLRLAAALAAVLLGAAAPAQAQDSFGTTDESATPATDDTADTYRIELIVFEYGDSLAGTAEDWMDATAMSAGETGPGDDADETDGMEDTGLVEVTDQPPELSFRPLGENEFALADVASRLARTRGYRLLLHVAWEQPGYDRESARPLALARLAALPDRLDGDVRLYRSRFLHLVLDLELVADEPAGLTTPVVLPGEDPFAALGPDVYRLDESRKMKSGELHYFDHPRFGALALVTPVEEVAP